MAPKLAMKGSAKKATVKVPMKQAPSKERLYEKTCLKNVYLQCGKYIVQFTKNGSTERLEA